MEMKCWDRFARKTMIYFTGNKTTRVPSMETELARVGLADADRQWQYPTPIDRLLLRSMRHIPSVEKGGFFNASMGHYRAIATAYHLGCPSVLVMEDDIRFLKDASLIAEAVDALPADYDVALLDLFAGWMKNVDANTVKKWREERKVNEWWAEFDEMRSMGCYALSRRGMERLMFCFEAVETAPRVGKMRICDHFLDRSMLGKGIKLYFARKNIAVQQTMGAANSDMSITRQCYADLGLDLAEYAEA